MVKKKPQILKNVIKIKQNTKKNPNVKSVVVANTPKVRIEGFNINELIQSKSNHGIIIMRHLSNNKISTQREVNDSTSINNALYLKESSLAKNVIIAAKMNFPNYIKEKAEQNLLNSAILNQVDENGCSSLFYSVGCDDPEIAYLLLKNGADPNLRNVYGNTALHQAFRKNNTDVFFNYYR